MPQQMVAWCPPGVERELGSVLVRTGAVLTDPDWWEALAARVQTLVDKADDPERAAQWAARSLGVPQPEEVYQAGECLVTHNWDLWTRLRLLTHARTDPYPAKVEQDDPAAREAMEDSDLEQWINLALAQMHDSSLD